jgi:hypothetical protein
MEALPRNVCRRQLVRKWPILNWRVAYSASTEIVVLSAFEGNLS